MRACLRHPSVLLSLHRLLLLHARQECVSPHPGSNPLFEVPSPSFALLMSSFPSLPFLHPFRLSDRLICRPRSSLPPAAARVWVGGGSPQTPSLSSPPLPHPRPRAPAPGPDHTCHLHRTQDGSREGFHPSLALHEPLIPLSPATLSLKNGRCRGPGRGGTQSTRCQGVSFKQGQKGNHCR